jgi:hypothetical protein
MGKLQKLSLKRVLFPVAAVLVVAIPIVLGRTSFRGSFD